MNINGVNTSSIVKINGVDIANVNKFNGITIPTGGNVITLTDVTPTCEFNKDFNVDPLNAALPTAAGAGDFVILIVASDHINSTNPWNIPTGWTRVYGVGGGFPDAWLNMYYRLFDGTEGATVDVTTVAGFLNRDATGVTFIANNIDTTNPIHVVGVKGETEVINYVDVPGVAYTVDGLALGALSHDGGDGDPYTYSSGWINLAQGECGGGGSDSGYAICYQNFTGSGNTGTLRFTANTVDGKTAIQVFLKQA